MKAACPVCRKEIFNQNEIVPNRTIGISPFIIHTQIKSISIIKKYFIRIYVSYYIANILQDCPTLPVEKSKEETTLLKLSITEKYAPSWKSRQGIREIVQNWHDGVKEAVHVIKHHPNGLVDLSDEALQHKMEIVFSKNKIDGNLGDDVATNFIAKYP